MTQTLRPPDLRQKVADLEAEVRRLQTAVRLDYTGKVRFEAVFSREGVIEVSESPGLLLEEGGKIANMAVLAKAAGSVNSVFEVYRNGVSLGGITLGAADLVGRIGMGPTQFGPDTDVVSVACTSAGGHSGITVQVRFR